VKNHSKLFEDDVAKAKEQGNVMAALTKLEDAMSQIQSRLEKSAPMPIPVSIPRLSLEERLKLKEAREMSQEKISKEAMG
jgi:hypothetical protein